MIVGVTYYQAVCDRCGHNLTADGDEISAWSDGQHALDQAEYGEAWVFGEFVLCEVCVEAYEQAVAPVEFARAAREDPLAVFAVKGWALALSTSGGLDHG